MTASYLASLQELALELETLKLHGYDHIEVSGDNWKETFRERLKEIEGSMANKKSPASAGNGPESLEQIGAQVAECKKCALAKTRTNTVFGVGDPNAELVFVGEGPGAEEDKQGEPFVGRAGKLLTEMIVAMGLSRERVYIANIVKCRPPGNRDPLPEEVEKCIPYLKGQLKAIKPKYICALGAVAARTLLQTDVTIGKLRSRFHDFEGVELLATYHPSYLLRNASAKPETWKDLQMIMKKLGLKDPRKKNG